MNKIQFKQLLVTASLIFLLAYFGSMYFYKWFVREDQLNSMERVIVHVDYYNNNEQAISINVIDSEMVNLIKGALLSGEYVPMPNKTGSCIFDATLTIENANESHKLLYSAVSSEYGRCWYSEGGWNLGAYDDTLLVPILLRLIKTNCNRDSLQ